MGAFDKVLDDLDPATLPLDGSEVIHGKQGLNSRRMTTQNIADLAGGGAGLSDSKRNRITNPCMQISLENGDTAGTTNNYFIADECIMSYSTSAGALSGQRIQSRTLSGALNRARISVTTADTSLGASEKLSFIIPLEGKKIADAQFGTADATDFVARFMGNFPAGTYAISLINAAKDRSYVREFTAVAGADTVYEVVFPGDTSGTWPTGNSLGAQLCITAAAGSTLQTTKDTWQAGEYYGTSAVSNGLGAVQAFDIGDIGLKLDPDQTGTYGDFEVPDEAAVEIGCFRYYQLSQSLKGQMQPANTRAAFAHAYAAPMRATPSVSIKTSTGKFVVPATSTLDISSIAFANANYMEIIGSSNPGAGVSVVLLPEALVYNSRMAI